MERPHIVYLTGENYKEWSHVRKTEKDIAYLATMSGSYRVDEPQDNWVVLPRPILNWVLGLLDDTNKRRLEEFARPIRT